MNAEQRLIKETQWIVQQQEIDAKTKQKPAKRQPLAGITLALLMMIAAFVLTKSEVPALSESTLPTYQKASLECDIEQISSIDCWPLNGDTSRFESAINHVQDKELWHHIWHKTSVSPNLIEG